MGLRQVVSKYDNYLKNDDYDYIFRDLKDNQADRVELINFLYNKCGIDVLQFMTKIPDGMFSYSDVKTITIPDTIESIGREAFSPSSISQVYISDSVKDIGMAAFEGCKNLSKVRLPKGIEELQSKLFMGCSNLKLIFLPDSVKNIGSKVFEGCADDIMIVTSFRRGVDKIKFPGSEVDFYKAHLKFKRQ